MCAVMDQQGGVAVYFVGTYSGFVENCFKGKQHF